MAEGLLRYLMPDKFECFSAGTKATSVNPLAVEVMKEIDIDISLQKSDDAIDYIGQEFDMVVTVCDNAKESCPFFPGAKEYMHVSFEDPADATGSKKNSIFSEKFEMKLYPGSQEI